MNKNLSNKNIILVGYPKSGTNWLSRLIADVTESSFIGDWGFTNNNVSNIKRTNNNSRYQVYKSHHSFQEVFKASSKPIDEIIYLIRNPRDIVISGNCYFSFSKLISEWLQKIRLYKVSYYLSVKYNKFLTYKSKRYKMTTAVLYGNNKITRWLKIPWEKHYLGYKHQDILFIKYEDLIDDPEKECLKILSFLNVQKSRLFIQECIENQSFQKRKNKAQNQDNLTLKN